MTLPCASLPRLDPVTVGTADDALVPFDLTLNRRDGLERRHVGRLPLHVVNVKRSRVGGVSAVHAPVRRLVVRYPLLHHASPVVGDRVVSRLRLRVAGAPDVVTATGGAVIRALGSGTARAERGAELRSISFRGECAAALRAGPISGGRVLPGRHISIVPVDDRYPCKPDIFAATYEPADADDHAQPKGETDE